MYVVLAKDLGSRQEQVSYETRSFFRALVKFIKLLSLYDQVELLRTIDDS